jgi:hypothetical protein
MGGQRVVHWVG